MDHSQKLNIELAYDRAILFTLGYIAKRIENICAHKNLYTHGHSSIIHNCQEMETTQISINEEWINKIL